MMADPNKYKKNANIRPDTLVQTIVSVGSMLLMLIGIIGLAMELFKDEGWLKSAIAWLFDSTAHMVLFPVIILALWFLNRWFSTPSKSETKRSGNIPMYIMMIVGAYYLFRIVTTGGF